MLVMRRLGDERAHQQADTEQAGRRRVLPDDLEEQGAGQHWPTRATTRRVRCIHLRHDAFVPLFQKHVARREDDLLAVRADRGREVGDSLQRLEKRSLEVRERVGVEVVLGAKSGKSQLQRDSSERRPRFELTL